MKEIDGLRITTATDENGLVSWYLRIDTAGRPPAIIPIHNCQIERGSDFYAAIKQATGRQATFDNAETGR